MEFASTILMIRPAAFGYNEQTAVNNAFQQNTSFQNLQQQVLKEFDEMVATIRSVGIEVMVVDDTPDPVKPDAVFPNNWFCTMPDGSISIFPMYAANRRIERREDIISHLQVVFNTNKVFDWTGDESNDIFLEGTGSMVIDHQHNTIYACVSERTNTQLLERFAKQFSYNAIKFVANDKHGKPIYHTNVMMFIGNGFAVVCDESIKAEDKQQVLDSLAAAGKEIISITQDQVKQFAGNMLQLQNKKGEHFLVMSASAFNSLTEIQKQQLQQFTGLLPVNISTIETIGGGSARCMMAEIFLPKS